jgi:hypothetical protein
MPFTKEIALDGPEGHVQGKLTEWDYDRAGGAYVIQCECGWVSQQHWNRRDVDEEYGKHLDLTKRMAKAREMSNDELSAHLVKAFQNALSGIYSHGNEYLLEAANRLVR